MGDQEGVFGFECKWSRSGHCSSAARAMAMAAVAAGNQVHNVFVYGSLLADDVVRALLSRIPQSSPAILNGYHRFSIKGRVYPAILPAENKKVSGKVLHGITDPELYILDEFEDVEYERVTVDVFFMVSCQFILRKIGIELKNIADHALNNRKTILRRHKHLLMSGQTKMTPTCMGNGFLR
ncbi:hypothetical protein D5086_014135 [Populus alba]|uniref:Uncharacterized protein n=1 Tax=Populus alba TaxID=43335 RepID=A0ACC4C8G5_POPAL